MRDSWLELVGCVFQPTRPRLAFCLQEREHHLEARRIVGQERARKISNCEARIEAVRAEVFAAQDGVVTARMTDLEREWRLLSRKDPDAGLMDLWARMAPSSWIDRKRWRDSAPGEQLDAATALAADVDGVEAAEAAIDALRIALAKSETPIGARCRWQLSGVDFDGTTALLAKPLEAARSHLVAGGATSDGAPMALSYAQILERDVHDAALARFPERPILARALGHAAFVDCVWRHSNSNPVTPLCALWRTGYVLSAVDEHGVTLAIPPID